MCISRDFREAFCFFTAGSRGEFVRRRYGTSYHSCERNTCMRKWTHSAPSLGTSNIAWTQTYIYLGTKADNAKKYNPLLFFFPDALRKLTFFGSDPGRGTLAQTQRTPYWPCSRNQAELRARSHPKYASITNRRKNSAHKFWNTPVPKLSIFEILGVPTTLFFLKWFGLFLVLFEIMMRPHACILIDCALMDDAPHFPKPGTSMFMFFRT